MDNPDYYGTGHEVLARTIVEVVGQSVQMTHEQRRRAMEGVRFVLSLRSHPADNAAGGQRITVDPNAPTGDGRGLQGLADEIGRMAGRCCPVEDGMRPMCDDCQTLEAAWHAVKELQRREAPAAKAVRENG
jgi:hypothetical protein